ncbi:glycosyl hydrolase family 61-domain-containing protein [Whalleya microplaca]|nr:glycosyl hydrolase family 61-domain-containing protein [Whalleya microplaca]
MHFSNLIATAAFATIVSAHTTVFSVWVNDEDQGDGRNVYIRSPPNNNPVKDLTSSDLVCNVNGGTAVASFVSAAAGDKVTFEWYHNTRGDDIIDSSHKGPIITYIAPYTEGNGADAIWTKINEEGLTDQTWAVDTLISNKGKKEVTLPSGLAAGKYLLRQEIIALHEADVAYASNSARGAQFYPSCVQLEVTGSGSTTPSENFDFNTGYTSTDPGIVYNLYTTPYAAYTIPGPTVWSGSGSGSGSASTSVKAVASSAVATSKAAATSAATSASTSAAKSVATSVATSAASSAATTLTQTRAPTSAASSGSATSTAIGSGSGSSSGSVALYGQCGGSNYSGATTCAAGTCKEQNPYYSQCVAN